MASVKKNVRKGFVYAVFCKANGRSYIGSTVDLNGRRQFHFRELKRGLHHSLPLQNSYNKYGEAAFEFGVVEIVDDTLFLVAREQFWINWLGNKSLNGSPTAGSPLGVKRSKAWCENLSNKMKGNTNKKGKPNSENWRILNSERMKGNTYRKGILHSQENKEKISIGVKKAHDEGRMPQYTPENIAKYTVALNNWNNRKGIKC